MIAEWKPAVITVQPRQQMLNENRKGENNYIGRFKSKFLAWWFQDLEISPAYSTLQKATARLFLLLPLPKTLFSHSAQNYSKIPLQLWLQYLETKGKKERQKKTPSFCPIGILSTPWGNVAAYLQLVNSALHFPITLDTIHPSLETWRRSTHTSGWNLHILS